MKTPKKYRPLTKEPMMRFVARIVDDEGKPMTADEVMTFCDKRHSKLRKKTRVQFQAHLSDAVRHGHLAKTRIQTSDTQSRVHYHPLGMHPIGDEIPMPLFTKNIKHEKRPLADFNVIDFSEKIAEVLDADSPRCDICNDDTQVGFVDNACTFKVCERCDTDGVDFTPDAWPQEVMDELNHKEHLFLEEGIDLDDLPTHPAPQNDPRIPEHLHWGNKPDADWKFTPVQHSDAFKPIEDFKVSPEGKSMLKEMIEAEQVRQQKQLANSIGIAPDRLGLTVDNIIQLRPLFMKHGRLTTIREFRFTARELIDQLHELDVRLYEQVLDTITDGLGIKSEEGWFGNDNGDMCIREEVSE